MKSAAHVKSALPQTLVPTLRREDITWRTVSSKVHIQVDLANETSEPMEAAVLVIEAAAFGAFVPFEPVARIAVAGFDPGERRNVVVSLDRERLEAVSGSRRGAKGFPAVDEWAGNLNVYFDRAPEDAVEVHRARDLKVRAGRKIAFTFLVGEPCTFEARRSDPAWSSEIITEPPAILVVGTPAIAGLWAAIEVLVMRTADGKVVPVEFTMETIEGESDKLGCVQVSA